MSDEPAPRAERRVVRALLLPVVALLALAGCEDPAPGGGRPPGDGGPGPRPPVQPPEGGGFTPTHERVVGFPALFRDSHPEEVREAEAEAGRVTAMHERGGTGRGQVVGTVESGANPDHPDLQGQFAHTCAMGRCDDGRPNRSDHSPLDDTDDHGTQVNGIVVASKNGLGMYGVAYEARIASYGNTAPTFPPWGNDCDAYDCPPGVRDKRHQWSALFDQEIARGIDWMRGLGVRVTNFSWGRTYEWSREKEERYGITAGSVRSIMPKTLPAFRAYVDAGGVAVWAAGNGDSLHPAVEGMVPRYYPELEKGWLVGGGAGHGRADRVLLPLLRRRAGLVHRGAGRGSDDASRWELEVRRRHLDGRAVRGGCAGRAEEHGAAPELSRAAPPHSRDGGPEPAV